MAEASTFYLEIITPERQFYIGPAEALVFPAVDGEMGVYPGHEPAVTAVEPGELRYKVDGVQMQLSWRPDFGAEKTAALQKAQYAMAQEAARLIDSDVPLDTGKLKNSVQTASKYDEGLLVYNTPYARKQYYLHAEGSDLRTFMGNKERGQEADKYKGLRGSYWGQRALADMGEHLALYATRAVTMFWGGMGHL